MENMIDSHLKIFKSFRTPQYLNKKLPSGKTKIPKLDSSSSLDGTDINKLADHAFYIVKRTKHLAYFDWLDKAEMVSVEINPLSLLEKLPPGLKKEKFGTK